MANNTTNRRLGIVLQYGQMALNIIINLIYTPIMLRILGDSEYGIYSISASVISYLSLLSLGFGAGYIRFYSRYAHVEDTQGIRRLNGLYLIVFSLMGSVALAAGVILSRNVSIFFNATYSQQDLEIARKLMILLALNLAISFPASVFVSYVTSQQKFIFQKALNIGKTVLSPCLSIAILFLGYGSVGMAVVTTAVSLVIDVFNIAFCIGPLKMRFSFGRPDLPLLKSIAAFSAFIAINQIIDQINWQTDKVILGKVVNATAVALYSVAAQLNSMFISFSVSVSSVFTTKIHKIVNSEEPREIQDRKLTDLFIRVGRVQFAILMLILTGFVFFGPFFIRKWAGEGYADAYYIALLLMVPATVALCQNTGIEIQRAENKHQFRSIVYLLMAVLNVGISILFCHLWGAVGVATGTAIALILANGVIMNIYYQKALRINIKAFWRNLLRMSPGLIVPICVGVLFRLFVPIAHLWSFAACIIVYSVIYLLSMWFLGFNQYEKSILLGPVKKILRRKNAELNG